MNLCDIIGNGEVFTDVNSGYKFGKSENLTVLGWYKRIRHIKQYVVQCDVCNKNDTLFGSGHFSTDWGRIKANMIPCGCSKSHKYTEAEYTAVCKATISNTGFKFIGWAEEYRGVVTKCIINCSLHGNWTVKGYHLVLSGSRCRQCSLEANLPLAWEGVKISDEDYIRRFKNEGGFIENTVFSRDLEDSQMWTYLCTMCGEEGRNQAGRLLKGQLSCACSSMSQKYAYISYIMENSLPLAIKLGITKYPSTRATQQRLKCIYDLRLYGIWEFENVFSCKEAERICKNTLTCGILSKEEMKDGWTETTSPFNLEAIIKVFEGCGGIRVI